MPYRNRPGKPVDVGAFERIPSRPARGVGTPGSPASRTVPNVVVFPPKIYPPPGAQQLLLENVLSVGPGPTTVVLLPAFRLPPNSVGVIREFTLDANNTLASSLIFLSLRFNQAPVQGYNNYQLFPSAAARQNVSFVAESTVIDMPNGVSVDVIATVNDAGTYLLGATVRGWFYPADVAARYGYR